MIFSYDRFHQIPLLLSSFRQASGGDTRLKNACRAKLPAFHLQKSAFYSSFLSLGAIAAASNRVSQVLYFSFQFSVSNDGLFSPSSIICTLSVSHIRIQARFLLLSHRGPFLIEESFALHMALAGAACFFLLVLSPDPRRMGSCFTGAEEGWQRLMGDSDLAGEREGSFFFYFLY